MSLVHLVSSCCCAAAADDCCAVWGCATQNLTHVVISYSEVTTRTYANGQSFVISDAVWTLEGDLAWNNSGQNCENWYYHADELAMSFNCITRQMVPDTFPDATPYDPGPGYGPCESTLPIEVRECSGCRCDESGEFVCDYDIVYCVGATRELSWTGTVQRTGQGSEKLLYIGCTNCCGCIRPFVELDPNGAGAFTEISNSETYDEQCCGFDSNDYSTTWTPAFGTAGNEFTFAILGTCACMDANAFDDPVYGSVFCNGQGAWGSGFHEAAMSGVCMSVFSPCGEVNNTTYIEGSDYYAWFCDYWLDGTQYGNFCEYNMAWTDTTVRSITVTLT